MHIASNIIPIVLFVVIAVIVKIVSDNRVRHKLIEKGALNENTKYLFTDPLESHASPSLKWGMVLIGIGIAFLIGQFVPTRMEEEITLSMLFLFAGLALLIYYFIASQRMKKETAEKSLQ